MLDGGMQQIDQIRTADLDPMGGRQLGRQHLLQPAEIARGPPAGELLLQALQGIDKEDFRHVVVRAQVASPIVADVLVELGVRLHENQPAAIGGQSQLVRDAARAVFLLSGGVDQHVAVRQQFVQSLEVAAFGVALRRVRIRTIDQNNVLQEERVDAADVEFLRRKPQRTEIGVGMDEEQGARRRRTLSARAGALAANDRVDQRALAGPRAAERGDDQRCLEPNAERIDP